MDRWVGKLAIITGASSGIGQATTRALVNKGVNVLGLARRENNLKELAESLQDSEGSFVGIPCDLRNEQDILDAFEYAEKTFGGVDILINNAGMVKHSEMADTPTEVFRSTMEVNVIAVAICTREALKSMRKHGKQGHIVFINSVIGRNAKVDTSVYCNLYGPSKYALRSMVEGLRIDIFQKKDKIRLTSIFPGLVRTEIIGNINDFEEKVQGSLFLEAEDITDSIMYALSAPPLVQIDDLVIGPLDNTI